MASNHEGVSMSLSLLERLHEVKAVRDRLRNPPNAVDDTPIDLKQKQKKEIPTLPLRMGPITPYPGPRFSPTLEDITRVVCEHYGVLPDELQAAMRPARLVQPRQMWAYLARTVTQNYTGRPVSFPEIGRRLGGRDHTTAKHACDKLSGRVETDRGFAEEVAVLIAKIDRVFSIRKSICVIDPREF
jgi:hypothetical protein